MAVLHRLISGLVALFDYVLQGLFFLSGAILAFLMFSVCWDVIARTTAGKPLTWVLEFSEYGLLYMCFLATAWVLRKDRHVTSDLLLVSLTQRRQLLFSIFTSILGLIICGILTWSGLVVSLEKLREQSYQPTTHQFPDFPLFIIIPVGFFLLSIQFLRRFWQNLGRWKSEARDD